MSTEARERAIRSLTKFAYYVHGGKRRHIADTLRTPATIDPDDREKWRGFAASYAHLGRDVEGFVRDAHALGSHGRHATRTVSRDAIDAEVAAFRAELPGVFPEPADQPLPVVRLSSQAGLASVRGGL